MEFDINFINEYEIFRHGLTYNHDEICDYLNNQKVDPDPYQMVDLGLSVKWCSCNIGATSPEDDGLYFAWGDTEGFEDSEISGNLFSESWYKSRPGYNLNTDITTSNGYDAARENMGDYWRMPTEEEFEELIDNTTITSEQINGINCKKFTASNGNYIILPVAGRAFEGQITKLAARYYSSTISEDDTDYACLLSSDRRYSSASIKDEERYYGLPIRAVYSPVDLVDLGLPSGLKWSKWNVGATKEEEYGKLFAFGDITGSDATAEGCSGKYTEDWYKEKGLSDINSDLTLAQDAANVAYGGNYRMPTKDEIEELIENTEYSLETINGVAGCKFTASNGNYIFFPFVGYGDFGSLEYNNEVTLIWSSSYYDKKDNAWFLMCSYDLDTASYDNMSRYPGLSVRAVCE